MSERSKGENQESSSPLTKEQWAEAESSSLANELGIDLKTAEGAVRWAINWNEDFWYSMVNEGPITAEETKSRMEATWLTSLHRTESVLRYPTGAPSLRSIIAAERAFCDMFNEEADMIHKILSTNLKNPDDSDTIPKAWRSLFNHEI